MNKFDVIVIGGGHAGAEAARVAARAGVSVALVTMIREAIGRMSCNPAIGGLAKGHLVKEIDALGGLMGEATDASGIQFKILNRSKGPAVQGPRAQCDRDLYSKAVLTLLEAEPGITIVEGAVRRLLIDGQTVSGIELLSGETLIARQVVVTTGTFLKALMHTGEEKRIGGRFDEPAAETLSDSLRELGLELGRLKTGTPPRVFRESADFSKMEPQPGDQKPRPFSILTTAISLPQVLCYVTYTNEQTHAAIRGNLHRAPMYSGQIQATGPRYCPSIEDKVVRFADKERHQVFVEPEGLSTDWLYLNGISTSLPADVQDEVIRSLPGLGSARVARYGYAVEYDYVNPQQLEQTLAVRGVSGLYLAGQINGTSGYEEAAAQGYIAGLNAAAACRDLRPFILGREESYIGVMIDDLVTQGTEEPYRMFTSRAEHRLLLGCDSVYERLSPLAAAAGVLDPRRLQLTRARSARMTAATALLAETTVSPDRETVDWLGRAGISVTTSGTAARLLQRNDFDFGQFLLSSEAKGKYASLVASMQGLSEEEFEGVVSRTRYAGYIERQRNEAVRAAGDEKALIPAGFSYRRPGLSLEVVEKLEKIRPRSVAQASRIPGVTPAAVALLRMHIRNGGGRLDGSGPSAGAL